VLFAINIYTISSYSPYRRAEEICLTVLYTSFLFITGVDLVSQLIGEPIPDTPVGTTFYFAREKKKEKERERGKSFKLEIFA